MSCFNISNNFSYAGAGLFNCAPFAFPQFPQFNPNNINSCFCPVYPAAGAYYGSNLGLYITPNSFPYNRNNIWQYNFNRNYFNNSFNNPFNNNFLQQNRFSNSSDFWNTSTDVKSTEKVRKAEKAERTDYESTGSRNLAYWKSQGYDEEMGRRLAKDAVATCNGKADAGCVGYTRRTINRVYGTNFANAGKAMYFGENILSKPELEGKFKKFKINGIKNSEVPDGAILIWPNTAYRAGTPAGRCGHGGIASNGKVYSDCICQNLSKCTEIWIPVKA